MIRKFVVALAVAATTIFTPVATADPNVVMDDDQIFTMLLEGKGLLFNFKLQQYQGQRYCEDIMRGVTPKDALFNLMRFGEYSLDIAIGIASAASTAYCYCNDSVVRPPDTLCRQWETAYRRAGLY